MGRMIDADKLMLHLNDYALQEATFMKGGYAGKYDAIQECMKAVEEQPTAYDPDKVVEQMQALSDKADDDIAVCEADMIFGKLLDLKKEKACEWLTSTYQWSNGKMTNRGLSRT